MDNNKRIKSLGKSNLSVYISHIHEAKTDRTKYIAKSTIIVEYFKILLSAIDETIDTAALRMWCNLTS